MRKTRHRGTRRVDWMFTFALAAYNLVRIRDAVMTRIKPRDPDLIEVRLVQLKSGVAGLTGAEIARLKRAVANLSADWLLAAFDGRMLHLVPDVPKPGRRSASSRSIAAAGPGCTLA